MKTIGLIGGMSWESTQTYYRLVNQHVRTALGGLHSAKVVLYSVDFAEIEALQHQGNWEATAEILAAAVSIPLLHIADATAQVLQRQGIACVGLLGTRFTMEQAFYQLARKTSYF
jgi:aspartate racemase